MPTFTMELCEVLKVTDDIGLDSYPIFDEDYRKILNAKIVDHYFNQEIGRETISMFRLSMRRRMNEIMPYYNQLYLSEKIKIEPILNVDMTNTATGESKQSAKSDSKANSDVTGESESWNTDYPQTSVVSGESYASSGSKARSDTVTSSTGGETSTGDSSQTSMSTSKGTQGSQSAMLNAYRETFLNIDLQVILELSDCFMVIWNTSEDYQSSPVFRQIERLF